MFRLVTILAVLALGGAAAGYWSQLRDWIPAIADVARTAPQTTAVRSPGVPVEIAQAQRATSRRDIRAIGSLRSDESVQIATEIAGRVSEITFTEGQPVRQGDTLLKLDDALAKAEVADAQARFDLAKQNFDRATALARSGTGTERARDEATAALETARVALELAKVKLEKHTIRAPFPGVVGIRNLSIGAFVAVGTAIVNLEKIDALKVDFKIPETLLPHVRERQGIEIEVDALPDRKFDGVIYAIDPMVDVNGRALQVRARLPNEQRVLRPGLFARITIKGMTEQEVVIVPESAVVPRGGDMFVYRIEDGKAIESKVSLGARRDGRVEIVEGLSDGATVVIAGQQRLRDGAAVDVVASVPPARG